MNGDEGAILSEAGAFGAAWNRGDAHAAASFYAEDGVRAGASVKQEPGTVRMLTADFSVWQGGIEIQLANEGPALKGHVVQVMKKIDGRWLMLEAHPKLFPPPPSR